MEETIETLEELRADYQTLKESLAKQKIVSDRLMRQTMALKVKNMRSTVNVGVTCAALVILLSPLIFHYNPAVNASWYFVAGTVVLMLLCIWLDWKFNHKVQNTDISSCNLLTFSKHVRELKSSYGNWLKWGIGFALIWFGWLSAEVWMNTENPKMAISMITGLLCGGVVGGLIGNRMRLNIIKTCDEIISQIEAE